MDIKNSLPQEGGMSSQFSKYPDENELDVRLIPTITVTVTGSGNTVNTAGHDLYRDQPPRHQAERDVADFHPGVREPRPAFAGSRHPAWKAVVAAVVSVAGVLATIPLSWRAQDQSLATIQAWDTRREISYLGPSHGVSRPPAVRGVSLLLDQAGQFLGNGAPDQACDQFRSAWQGLAAEYRARIDAAEIRTAENECSGREFPTGANRYERAFQPISP
jgi:hypothetical protein